MPFSSTRHSIERGQITVLACIETIAATMAMFLIYWQFGSFKYVATAATIAPLLLLWTPASKRWALMLTDRIVGSQHKKALIGIGSEPLGKLDTIRVVLRGMWFSSLSLLTLPGIKLFALGYGLTRRPAKTLSAIPDNWKRVVLCTDFRTLPELMPGLEEYEFENHQSVELFKISGLFSKVFDDVKVGRFVACVPCAAALVLFFVLAGIYRWSLKSTALIWSPFVWIFRPLRKSEDPAYFARSILDLNFYKASRAYSLIVVLLFGTKLFIWVQFLEASNRSLPYHDLFERYVIPESIVTWHIAAVINSVLTWIIYFRAERVVHEETWNRSSEKRSDRQFFRRTFLLRNCLSVYTAFCLLYITLSFAINLPPMRILLLPWQAP